MAHDRPTFILKQPHALIFALLNRKNALFCTAVLQPLRPLVPSLYSLLPTLHSLTTDH